MVKYNGVIQGLFTNVEKNTMQSRLMQVNYTSDDRGKTLSIGSLADGIQLSIPFDELYKIITKEA